MITSFDWDDKNQYERLKISRRNHNILFPHRKLGLFKKARYYLTVDGNKFVLAIGINFLGKIVVTILLPLTIILEGVSNTKSIFKEYKSLIKNESQNLDDINKGGELFDKIMKVAKIKTY